MRQETVLHADSLDEYATILTAAHDLADNASDVRLLDGYSFLVPAELGDRIQQYLQASESPAPRKRTAKKESAE